MEMVRPIVKTMRTNRSDAKLSINTLIFIYLFILPIYWLQNFTFYSNQPLKSIPEYKNDLTESIFLENPSEDFKILSS